MAFKNILPQEGTQFFQNYPKPFNPKGIKMGIIHQKLLNKMLTWNLKREEVKLRN